MSGAANDVSNSHEPSYYEIALTNRQVVVAFVLLLLCLIAAFFSGVWIGRESGVRTASEQMVRNTPPAQEEKKEGQNLEEFEFFDSAQKGKPGKSGKSDKEEARPAAPAPEPPSQAGTDTTLAEDFGAEDLEAGAGAAPASAPAAARPKPTPAPAPERVAQSKPPQQEPPAARPPKRAERATEPSAEPARSAGQVVIQVFSSAEREQAVRIRDRLVGGGHKAYLSPVEVSGRTMYRVRIGPFGSRDKAQQAAEQVRKGYKLDTWVTE